MEKDQEQLAAEAAVFTLAKTSLEDHMHQTGERITKKLCMEVLKHMNDQQEENLSKKTLEEMAEELRCILNVGSR